MTLQSLAFSERHIRTDNRFLQATTTHNTINYFYCIICMGDYQGVFVIITTKNQAYEIPIWKIKTESPALPNLNKLLFVVGKPFGTKLSVCISILKERWASFFPSLCYNLNIASAFCSIFHLSPRRQYENHNTKIIYFGGAT